MAQDTHRDAANDLFGKQRQAEEEAAAAASAKPVLSVRFTRRGKPSIRCFYAYMMDMEVADDFSQITLKFHGREVVIEGRRLQPLEESLATHTAAVITESFKPDFQRSDSGPEVTAIKSRKTPKDKWQ